MSAPAPTTSALAETLNILLDKGLVIDATIRVSVIGIEILTIEARIVVASVDTFIRYLEAIQRLDAQSRALPPGTVPAPGTQGLAGTFGLLPVATPVLPAGLAQPGVTPVVSAGFAQTAPAPAVHGEDER